MSPTIKSVADVIGKMNVQNQASSAFEYIEKRRSVVRNLDDVIDIVAKYYSLTKSDLVGEERRKEIMTARQVSMYLIREILDQSYEAIGDNFGGRNHTTVMHACNKIANQLKIDNRLLRDLEALKKELGF